MECCCAPALTWNDKQLHHGELHGKLLHTAHGCCHCLQLLATAAGKQWWLIVAAVSASAAAAAATQNLHAAGPDTLHLFLLLAGRHVAGAAHSQPSPGHKLAGISGVVQVDLHRLRAAVLLQHGQPARSEGDGGGRALGRQGMGLICCAPCMLSGEHVLRQQAGTAAGSCRD